MINLKIFEKLIKRAISNKVFPGCAVLISRRGDIIINKGFGNFSYNEKSKKVNNNTIYDLASLTKVIATVTAVMLLKDKNEIELEKNVGFYIPEFKGEHKDKVKVKNLLSHSSGLPPWKPLFESSINKQSLLENLYKIPLEYEPGEKCDYSDLGFILLSVIIEKITSVSFDEFCYSRILNPLGMKNTQFCPPENVRDRIPPTENCSFRKKIIQGEVHDENAYVMGGVSGHAGLFGNTGDIAIFCQMILSKGKYKNISLVSSETVQKFTEKTVEIPGCRWSLGWRMFMKDENVVGDYFSEKSFGHLGYTGTSIYLDPVKEFFIILLTNRVHPTRKNKKISEFRPAFHNEVLKSLEIQSIT